MVSLKKFLNKILIDLSNLNTNKEDKLYIKTSYIDNFSISANSLQSPAIDCSKEGYDFVTPLYFNCTNATTSGQNVSSITSYGMYTEDYKTIVKLYNRGSKMAKIKVIITGIYRKEK